VSSVKVNLSNEVSSEVYQAPQIANENVHEATVKFDPNVKITAVDAYTNPNGEGVGYINYYK